MRLDKALAASGYGTRSEVKTLIAKGLVSVSGKVIKDPGYRIPDDELNTVEVQGQSATIREKIYLMFNKPDGVLTAMEDKRLHNVGEFIPANLKGRKLSPVGRLDFHTTGLLILTNDGELSHRITSPNYDINKVYEVTYEGPSLTSAQKDEARQGVTLLDKDKPVKLKPAVLEFVNEKQAYLTLTEGKTHEVRRIFAQWERPVTALKRVSVGSLHLDDDLEAGGLRELTNEEIDSLKELTGLL
ncbi:MAG: rRNA pseudouridine synthase [Clostridiales bacterium]|nr:rRNA pseudouridine synthase [Clostridiales bacterium]